MRSLLTEEASRHPHTKHYRLQCQIRPAAISGSIPAKNRSWSVCRNKLNPQQPCPGKPPAFEPWCPSAADPVLASLPSWLEGLSAPSCTQGLNIRAFIYSNRGRAGSLEGILIDAVPQSKHAHVTYWIAWEGIIAYHDEMTSTSPYAVSLWQRSIPDGFGTASLKQLSPALALPPSLVRSLAFSQLLWAVLELIRSAWSKVCQKLRLQAFLWKHVHCQYMTVRVHYVGSAHWSLVGVWPFSSFGDHTCRVWKTLGCSLFSSQLSEDQLSVWLSQKLPSLTPCQKSSLQCYKFFYSTAKGPLLFLVSVLSFCWWYIGCFFNIPRLKQPLWFIPVQVTSWAVGTILAKSPLHSNCNSIATIYRLIYLTWYCI